MEENDDFKIELSLVEDDDPGFQLRKTCANLFSKGNFVDVTLSCLDGNIGCHRIVLSSASSSLYNLLVSTPWPTPCTHPVIILRKALVSDVRASLDFIYSGKVKTSKNKLISLLEVGRELGFTSLLKSIESAIQVCGIEMFRRMSGNSSSSGETPLPQINSSPSTKSKYSTDFPNNIVIKEEPHHLFEDEGEIIPEDSNEIVKKGKRRNPSPLLNASKKITRASGGKNSNHNKMSHLWSEKKTGESNGDLNNGNISTPVNLQHERGESFIYTNEDLGMVGNEEEYQNESEDEMILQNQEMTDENSMSILSNPSNAKLNGNDISPFQMKEEQEDVPASCPWCMQVFTSLTLLQRHIKSHVGNYKPFTCEYCQNTFARSAHLKRHLRTHTGEKPYQCSICQRLFARQDKLKVHLERHLHTPSQTPAKSESLAMSYPPQSQNSGGQVPIKILIPTNKTKSTHTVASPNGNSNPPISLQKAGKSVRVTSTSTKLHSPLFSDKSGESNCGSPTPPTITPINNVVLSQNRIGKSMNYNFLVN